MKKNVTVILAIVLSLSFFGNLAVAMTDANTENTIPVYEPIRLDGNFRETAYGINFGDMPSYAGAKSPGPRSAGSVGDTMVALTLDDYNGQYVFTTFVCRAVGNNAEIWVQADLSYPEGDPRPTPVVTDEQVTYLLAEFDNNIYPIDTTYFGEPDFHDGTYSLLSAWGYVPPGYYYEETGKNLILVSNIRDQAYYEPDYPYYIAGFYSPSIEAYTDRNVISVDCYNWEDRVGYDVARPNLYESVIAHEYQHLIHDDWNPDDDTFMNEGCSMYAEVLCGYELDWGAMESFFATPDNSLTEWGDQGDINILADYGAAMAWTIYLSDQYGGADFISHFVKSGVGGIAGLNLALADFGYSDTFDDAFHNWRIANLIHTGDGKYNYKSIDLNDASNSVFLHEVKKSPHIITGSELGTTTTILGYDTGISLLGSYGTDYLHYDLWTPAWTQIQFDGDDEVLYGWRHTPDGWYSGQGDLMNTLLLADTYVDPADPTLYLNTYWDIEDYWDFAFVQVSTDGGETWTSLENEYTTYEHNPNAHPDIIANLPGITGWVGEVLDISFDLSAYAGQNIMLGFRYMTDWAFTYSGWYIFDAKVGDVPLDLYKGSFIEASFMVTLVANTDGVYEIYDLPLDEFNSYLDVLLREDWDSVVLIVSGTQDFGFVDYKFGVTLGYHRQSHFIY